MPPDMQRMDTATTPHSTPHFNPHATPAAVIPKENNFQQPGQRYRSWDPARQVRCCSRRAACPCLLRFRGACAAALLLPVPRWRCRRRGSRAPAASGSQSPTLIMPLMCTCHCRSASSSASPTCCWTRAAHRSAQLRCLFVALPIQPAWGVAAAEQLLLDFTAPRWPKCQCLRPTLLPPHCPAPPQEIRRVWLGMLSQCDQGLGQKLAAKLQAASAL